MKIFKWFIVIGAILSLGFLSFAGLFLLNPTWFGISPLIWSIAAFGLAVIIESLVYAQNIDQGWKKWAKSGEDYLEEVVSADVLAQHVKCNPKDESVKIQEDKKSLVKCEHIEEALNPIDWILAPRKRWQLYWKIAALKAAIKASEEKLINNYLLSESELKFNASIKAEIKKRSDHTYIWVIIGLAILSGISTFFASLAAIQASLPHLPIILGSTTIWAIGLSISFFSAIGTFFLVYNNLMQLMHERTFEALTPKETSDYLIGIFVLGVTGYVSATVFWTWFTSGETSAMSIVNAAHITILGAVPVGVIIGVLAVVTFITTFIWNVTNMIRSIKMIKNHVGTIPKKFKKAQEALNQNFKKDREEGNLHHFFNPFGWLEGFINFLCRSAILLAHGASIGTTANQLSRVPVLINTTISAAAEVVGDLHYLGHSHEHGNGCSHSHISKDSTNEPQCHSHDDEHDCKSHSNPSKESTAETLYQVENLPEAEHSHFDLSGILLIFILIPVKIVRFILDAILSLLWTPLSRVFCSFFKPHDFLASTAKSFKTIFSNQDLEKFQIGPLQPTVHCSPFALITPEDPPEDKKEKSFSANSFCQIL